ncbi:MAG: NADH-quinone oxidoreductase subunit C [Thermodesulfobacteriota bacterium]
MIPIQELVERFGQEHVLEGDYGRHGFHVCLSLDPAGCHDLAGVLKAKGYYLEYITAVDRIDHLDLVYVFGSYAKPHRIQAVIKIAKGKEVPSLTDVYGAANWQEREVFDMFGQVFSGHPNLKNLLLPDKAGFHPLLKDFKAGPQHSGDVADLEVA